MLKDPIFCDENSGSIQQRREQQQTAIAVAEVAESVTMSS